MDIKVGCDILFAGIGGQGVVSVADVLANAATKTGYDVKKTDTLGMAQRGGGVISQVRIGDKIDSPIIEKGDVNFLVGLEKLEAVRNAYMLRADGITLLNNCKMIPTAVSNGNGKYPTDEEIDAELVKYADNVIALDAQKEAEKLGNIKVVSTIMLGALSMFLPIKGCAWDDALAEIVPEKLLDLNKRAFKIGRKIYMDEVMKAEPAVIEMSKEEMENI